MRILLLEDDEKLASLVLKALEQEGYNVTHVVDGERGFECLLEEHFDLAIFDIMLPKRNGLSVLKEVRERNILLPILILSAKDQVRDKVEGLHLGADDYLIKPFALPELIARVECLSRRIHETTTASELKYSNLTLSKETRRVFLEGQEVDLQPREYDLLKYLMEKADKVVSKAMIISHVWNYNFDPQTNVVETRICKLREKLEAISKKRLIHTVRGVGYVLRNSK